MMLSSLQCNTFICVYIRTEDVPTSILHSFVKPESVREEAGTEGTRVRVLLRSGRDAVVFHRVSSDSSRSWICTPSPRPRSIIALISVLSCSILDIVVSEG